MSNQNTRGCADKSIKSVELLELDKIISLGDVINGKTIGYIRRIGNDIICYDKKIKLLNDKGFVVAGSRFRHGEAIFELKNCSNYIILEDDTDKLIQDGLLKLEIRS
jgi:DNA integrity scanning protein DisA with diadenylate cyclase activity